MQIMTLVWNREGTLLWQCVTIVYFSLPTKSQNWFLLTITTIVPYASFENFIWNVWCVLKTCDYRKKNRYFYMNEMRMSVFQGYENHSNGIVYALAQSKNV